MVKEDKFKLIYAQFFPRGAETNGYARYVFNSFDVQGKQEITFTDFVIGLSVLTRGSIDEQLRWIFTLYDINSDGIITLDELNKIVNSIHDLMGKFAMTSNQAAALQQQGVANLQQQSLSSSSPQRQQQSPSESAAAVTAEKLFRKFDLNNDGMITLDEFLEACHSDDNIVKSISVFNTIL